MPLCVGISEGGAVVLGTPVVRVVGVPGIPMQRYWFAAIPPQFVPTVGFHLIKSFFENRPYILTISSQVSEPSALYHVLQVLIWFWGTEEGRFVSTGGAGRASPATTQ